MNKEELLKMARECGIDTGDNCTEFGENDLIEFVNSILERAAVECENVSQWKSIWDSEAGASYGADVCANEIRALKTQGD